MKQQENNKEGQELSTFNSQLSTEHVELSTFNSQLSTEHVELSTFNSQLSTEHVELSTVNSQLSTEKQLSTFNSQLSTKENIYPIFDRMLTRKDKEELLKQRSVMIWFTGLSGSGKSTIAIALERELHQRGLLCRILDGDNVRSGINNNLGFTTEGRVENIRRIAEVSKLFIGSGIITIAAFISPQSVIREMAARIIGEEDFLEVFVSTPLEECEKRDVKGLYAKARRGEIKNFTGISAPFEAPLHPALALDTSKITLEESVNRLLALILPLVKR